MAGSRNGRRAFVLKMTWTMTRLNDCGMTMGRAFSPHEWLWFDTWGVAPGWDGNAPLALAESALHRIKVRVCLRRLLSFSLSHTDWGLGKRKRRCLRGKSKTRPRAGWPARLCVATAFVNPLPELSSSGATASSPPFPPADTPPSPRPPHPSRFHFSTRDAPADARSANKTDGSG